MKYYERCYTSIKEAKQAQKIVGGTITSFLSINEKEEIITIYCLRYKQLF